MINSEYSEEDIALIKILAENEAKNRVDELDLNIYDKSIALYMIYSQILKEDYNIVL